MIADRVKRRMKAGCAAIVLIAATPLAWLDMPQASAQAMMRPNLNIAPRTPTINPTLPPRVDRNIAACPNLGPGVDRMRVRVNPNSTLPYARYSPNLYPACEAADRDAGGECQGKLVATSDGGSGGGKSAKGKGKGKGPNSASTTVNSLRFPNELLAEIDGSMSDEQVRALAQRNGLVLVESQNFPLIGATIGLFR